MNCAWDDGNAITRGTSVTSDVTIGLVTVPRIETGNITLLGSADEVAAGDNIELICSCEQAVSVNDDVSVDPAQGSRLPTAASGPRSEASEQ